MNASLAHSETVEKSPALAVATTKADEVKVVTKEDIKTVEKVAPIKPINANMSSDFEMMLAYVYKKSPELNAERAALGIADEKVAQAVAGFRPTLTADAAIGRQRQKLENTDWQYGDAQSAALNLTQPVFSGFGTLAERRASDQRVLAGRARLLAVEQIVLLKAISAWLEISEKEKIMSLVQDNLFSMNQYTNATRQRFEAGDGTQTDVAQAESRLAQAQGRLAQAEAEYDSARAAFERDTGLVAPATNMPPLPERLPISAEAAEQMAKNNPELMQAHYEEQAASEDIEVAESSLWPTVFVRGSMSEERASAFGLNSLRSDSLTLNASIPLYQGGGEYARVREAKLKRTKSYYDRVDLNRAVIGRAKFSWYNYRAAQTMIEASKKAAIASARALSGVTEEQREGLRDLTDVLDEQLQYLSTQIAETEAQKMVRVEAYRLLASTGQLTAARLRLAVPEYRPEKHYEDSVSRWVGF